MKFVRILDSFTKRKTVSLFLRYDSIDIIEYSM